MSSRVWSISRVRCTSTFASTFVERATAFSQRPSINRIMICTLDVDKGVFQLRSQGLGARQTDGLPQGEGMRPWCRLYRRRARQNRHATLAECQGCLAVRVVDKAARTRWTQRRHLAKPSSGPCGHCGLRRERGIPLMIGLPGIRRSRVMCCGCRVPRAFRAC
jgi:hypothetical protein